MAGKDQYKAADFIQAIPGTGGIISAIANKVGCSWYTAKKYIENYATVKEAYDAECEAVTDTADSILMVNLQALRKLQADAIRNGNYQGAVVDSADAKWYLTKKGKGRGYGDAIQIDGDLDIRLSWGEDADD